MSLLSRVGTALFLVGLALFLAGPMLPVPWQTLATSAGGAAMVGAIVATGAWLILRALRR